MAEYKVIQDIEAEDKLIGPLTLKQFIFACVASVSAFLAFMIASRTTAFAVIPFLPFILIPGLLAAPFGKDQPTDIWLAAQIRFFIKPRKRIWDQSGLKNLVTITVPKKIEKIFTDGLSQQEVRSRLKALADTIDSRGWAIKNADINMFSSTSSVYNESDRLIDSASLPQVVSDVDISAADDILDANSNPLAHHFDEMVKESTKNQHDAAIARMKQVAASQSSQLKAPQLPVPQEPMAPDSVMFKAAIVAPYQQNQQDSYLDENHATVTPEEAQILEAIKERERQAEISEEMMMTHHKMVKTPEELAAEEATKQQSERQKIAQASAVTPERNPVIVNLATNSDVNDGLSIKTLSELANQKVPQTNNGEVVINLRGGGVR
jgi:hypothetical protein